MYPNAYIYIDTIVFAFFQYHLESILCLTFYSKGSNVVAIGNRLTLNHSMGYFSIQQMNDLFLKN